MDGWEQRRRRGAGAGAGAGGGGGALLLQCSSSVECGGPTQHNTTQAGSFLGRIIIYTK